MKDHGRRCANLQGGHLKGHQDYKGRVFQAGEFWAEHPLDSPDQIEFFNQRITDKLQEICNNWETKLPEMKRGGSKEQKRVALEDHLVLSNTILHQKSGQDLLPRLASHDTCSFCLILTPLYPLLCGHTICQECLECFAKKVGYNLKLSECPLHADHEWAPPWTVTLKPPTAGLRILSLDGYV